MADASDAQGKRADVKGRLIRNVEELHDELTSSRTDWARVLASVRELGAAVPAIEALAADARPCD